MSRSNWLELEEPDQVDPSHDYPWWYAPLAILSSLGVLVMLAVMVAAWIGGAA